jgi:hypothetical protein
MLTHGDQHLQKGIDREEPGAYVMYDKSDVNTHQLVRQLELI